MSRTPPGSYSISVTAAVEWATKTFTIPSVIPAVSTTSWMPLVMSMTSPLPSVDTRICALCTPIPREAYSGISTHKVGGVPGLARGDDLLEALDHRLADLGESLGESRRVTFVHAKQVVEDEHLAVGRGAGADPDHGNVHAVHHRLRDGRGHGLEDDREAA